MLISQIGAFAATGCAHDEAFLDEERLADLFNGAGVLTHRRGNGIHANWPTLELVDDGGENPIVHVVEAMLIHIERFQADFCDIQCDGAATCWRYAVCLGCGAQSQKPPCRR